MRGSEGAEPRFNIVVFGVRLSVIRVRVEVPFVLTGRADPSVVMLQFIY